MKKFIAFLLLCNIAGQTCGYGQPQKFFTVYNRSNIHIEVRLFSGSGKLFIGTAEPDGVVQLKLENRKPLRLTVNEFLHGSTGDMLALFDATKAMDGFREGDVFGFSIDDEGKGNLRLLHLENRRFSKYN